MGECIQETWKNEAKPKHAKSVIIAKLEEYIELKLNN